MTCWPLVVYVGFLVLGLGGLFMKSTSVDVKLASLIAEVIGVLPIAFTLHWLCKLKRPGLAWGLLLLLLVRGVIMMYVMMKKLGPQGMRALSRKLQ